MECVVNMCPYLHTAGGFLWAGGVCYRLSGNGGDGAHPYSSVRLLLETWLQQASRMESGSQFLREVPQAIKQSVWLRSAALKAGLLWQLRGVGCLGWGVGMAKAEILMLWGEIL